MKAEEIPFPKHTILGKVTKRELDGILATDPQFRNDEEKEIHMAYVLVQMENTHIEMMEAKV